MSESELDIWNKYNYTKDQKCQRCGVDFIWFEYVKIKDDDGRLSNCGCPGNKENVTKCPNFIVYKRDTDIGMMLED